MATTAKAMQISDVRLSDTYHGIRRIQVCLEELNQFEGKRPPRRRPGLHHVDPLRASRRRA